MNEEVPDISNGVLALIILLAVGLVGCVLFTLATILWWIFA